MKDALQDILLCAWIALVSLAFWGPYAGLALPANVLIALYAVFLVTVIAAIALRLVKGNADDPAQSATNPVPRTEGNARRGR